jgi:hypothetical protein
MKKLFLLATLAACFTAIAQTEPVMGTEVLPDPISVTEPSANDNEAVSYATLPYKPEFPGGIKGFYQYLNSNIAVKNLTPEGSEQEHIKAIISFIVEKDGTMSDIKIIKDPGYNFGAEVIRVLKSMKTTWTPGKTTNQKIVRTSFVLPVVYKNPETIKKRETISNIVEVVEITADNDKPAIETAQEPNEPINFAALQVKPEFPGGINIFKKFITSNIKPSHPEGITSELKVTISFIVERDGTISKVQVLRDPGFGIGKEVERVLGTLKTKWQPGMQNGKPVRSNYILPIVYTVPK